MKFGKYNFHLPYGRVNMYILFVYAKEPVVHIPLRTYADRSPGVGVSKLLNATSVRRGRHQCAGQNNPVCLDEVGLCIDLLTSIHPSRASRTAYSPGNCGLGIASSPNVPQALYDISIWVSASHQWRIFSEVIRNSLFVVHPYTLLPRLLHEIHGYLGGLSRSLSQNRKSNVLRRS